MNLKTLKKLINQILNLFQLQIRKILQQKMLKKLKSSNLPKIKMMALKTECQRNQRCFLDPKEKL